MMDMRYEIRMQQYRDMLREAEEYRLARALGYREADMLRSMAAKLWARLSQIIWAARALAARGISVQQVIANREKNI